MAIQEIGIGIDLSKGRFVKTVFKDGKLQLTESGEDGDENKVYVKEGYWESEQIVINDKITSFKNLVRDIDVTDGSSYKGYTMTSDDGYIWTDYIEVSEDGTINSEPAKYAKIKLVIYAKKVESNFYVDKFDKLDKYDNEFINSSDGVLELKKEYTFPMNVNETNENIFSRKIEKTKFKKIDRIGVG